MTLIIKTTGWEDFLHGGGAYVKTLVMGPPGAGKTRSASFWPRPIFADCEQGRMSIADRGVAYAEIRSGEQMDQLLDIVTKECKKGSDRQWDTFVLDTLDSYQRTLIQERLASERKDTLSGWADWGHLDARMTQLIEKMLNLPMNIVVNLHVKETTERIEGEDDSRVVMLPKLKGDIKDQIAAEFDLVGYMATFWEAVDGERVLSRGIRWSPEPKYPLLKDRSGRLPQFTKVDFTEDDFTRLYSAIVGDFLDQMPESEVVAEVASEVTGEPVAGEEGGPVATVKDFPRRKSDLDPGPQPPAEQVVIDATPAPEPEPAEEAQPEEEPQAETPVPSTPVKEPADDVPAEKPAADADEAKREAPSCGDQTARYKESMTAVPGCGKPLTGADQDRLNIIMLRTGTLLCEDCFSEWKKNN